MTAGVGAGMITLAIAQNVVTPGNQALSQSFTRNAHDAVDISTTDPAIYEDETFTVNITFPESVTGFAVSDITVTGGALGTLTGSGASYSIPVTAASGAGNIVVSVAQDVVNEGNAAASATFTRLALPTVTITAIDTDIREGETFNVDIGFSASVTGFVVGDIAVTGASINGLTGSGTDYDLSLTANSGAGNIIVSIAANVVMPGNIANSVTFTRSAFGTVSITTTDADIRENETFTANITFPESVTGFAVSDITDHRWHAWVR